MFRSILRTICRSKWPTKTLTKKCYSTGKYGQYSSEDEAIWNQNKKSYDSNELVIKELYDSKVKYWLSIGSEFCEKSNKSSILTSLIDLIEQYANELTPDELEFAFMRLNGIMLDIKFIKIFHSITLKQKFINLIKESTATKLLSTRTVDLIDQLNNQCLLQALRFYSLIQINTKEQQAFKLIFDRLISRCRENELSLRQCLLFIKELNYLYPDNKIQNDQIHDIKQVIIRMTKIKLLNTAYDSKDMDIIVNNLHTFLNLSYDHIDLEAVTHLTNTLRSPGFKFEFKASLTLLRIIKSSIEHFHSHDDGISILKELQYNELIEKCNSTIYQKLVAEPTQKNVFLYVVKLHSYRDSISILKYSPNIYDPKLLNILSPVLMEQFRKQAQNRFLTYRLMCNMSEFNYYDERLLKFLYDYIVIMKDFRFKLGISSLYNLYTEVKFPFIDYQNLTDLLFDENSYQLELGVTQANSAIRLLCKIVLHNVRINSQIFDRLCLIAEKDLQSVEACKKFNHHSLNQIQLAKSYALLFKNISQNDTRRWIDLKFDYFIDRISKFVEKSKSINQYNIINSKLSKGSYLSNGVFINKTAIYDYSMNDLIPLTEEHNMYLNAVDQLALSNSQQICAIVMKKTLKGNISNQYEFIYNYRLKQLMKHFNIRPIEICEDVLNEMVPLDQGDYVIKHILNSFK